MNDANGRVVKTAQPVQLSQMDVPRSEKRLQSGITSKRPQDSNTVTSKRVGSPGHGNKQSLDYAMKTGLAGGIAGCAV